MSKEIYNRLELLSPGFLRKDVYKYAETNNSPVETLQAFTDDELLKLKIAQLYVLPQSQKRIPQQEKGHRKRMRKSTIGLKFCVLHDPSGREKYSNNRYDPKPIWNLPSRASTKFGGGILGRMSSNLEKPGKINFGNVNTILTNPRRQSWKFQYPQRS